MESLMQVIQDGESVLTFTSLFLGSLSLLDECLRRATNLSGLSYNFPRSHHSGELLRSIGCSEGLLPPLSLSLSVSIYLRMFLSREFTVQGNRGRLPLRCPGLTRVCSPQLFGEPHSSSHRSNRSSC